MLKREILYNMPWTRVGIIRILLAFKKTIRRGENNMAILEYTSVFAMGSIGYALIEIAFRGFTHWTMLPAGGLCFMMLYIISIKSRDSIWKKWIMGSCVITTIEFITGLIVNLTLGWNVWDYSHYTANLMGQISLNFSLGWLLICVPGVKLCLMIKAKLFSKSLLDSGPHNPACAESIGAK